MIKTIINYILHLDTYLSILIQSYGNWVYLILFLIVFLETGFVLTPFLPGDSLLFIAGTFAAAGLLKVHILFFILLIAAILGDTVNYWIGSYFGEKIFSKFINKEHMAKTKLFFHNHGKKTIVLARFIPVIRTFAPFVAGIGKMNYFKFLAYNIIGGILWVALFVFAGYYFGNIPYVKDNLTIIILLIIVISLIPVAWGYFKHKKKKLI